MGRVWVYGRYMNMYKRPCRRRNRDRTPRTGTGPAWAHMTSGDRATVHKPSTPATARRTARTQPQKHTRILCVPTAISDRHLCYAQRSRGGRAARPSATTPVRQPHAGRLAVAAPAQSGRCRGASCARSPAMLALAAIAQRPRPPPPSSGENPEAGNRNDQAPDKEALCRECTHGLGAQGECSGGGSG